MGTVKTRPAVLIVDDDLMLLRALERALRKRRDEWEITFVDSGEKAEAAIGAGSFDVIVTDLRMQRPGSQVLAYARAAIPRAVRVMMTTDHAGLTAIDAHFILEKPATFAIFENMLEAAVATSRIRL